MGLCVHCLTGGSDGTSVTVGQRQAGGGGVMLWAMFCWETLHPAIHVEVNLTSTTYLNMVAD